MRLCASCYAVRQIYLARSIITRANGRMQMNRSYLMRHISYQLHTFVKYFDINGVLTEHFCGHLNFDDFALSEELVPYCCQQCRKAPFPMIFEVDSSFCYSWIPDCDGAFLIGPVQFPYPVILNYQFQSDCDNTSRITDIPICTFEDFLCSILLVYNLYHEKELEQDYLFRSCCISKGEDTAPLKAYSELVFRNREAGRKHNPYDQEMREQYSIEQGNLELLQKSLEEDYIGELGIVSKDPLRNDKYLAVVVISLASRSAIRGGLTPELAFSLSDSYIQKIDECTAQIQVMHLCRDAEFQYAKMVQQLKKQQNRKQEKNPYIEQCKDYVFSYLHDKLEVADIAEHLCLNISYLSELFHEYEGITLKSYIRREKIELAKNLLTYSKYTYSEIAAYLGFSSQSHLGKSFKEVTGYTPGRYRREFSSSS